MEAVDFLHHENLPTWAMVEPENLGVQDQCQNNSATQPDQEDSHLIYCAVNGNAKGKLRLCQELFPFRRMRSHKMFQRLYRQQCENGSFTASTGGRCRSRIVRQTHLEEVILDHGDNTPGTSTRAVACLLHVSHQPFREFYCWTVGECNF
ncbi:hypothetical protein TNCV_393481 [Trichonephila clavipes]|nr:hypothetical protein TNCV_393481 [Trichonephila clavipes]